MSLFKRIESGQKQLVKSLVVGGVEDFRSFLREALVDFVLQRGEMEGGERKDFLDLIFSKNPDLLRTVVNFLREMPDENVEDYVDSWVNRAQDSLSELANLATKD